MSDLEIVFAYHERTKHSFHRYAPSLGYMDWANQPHPFRHYQGAAVQNKLIPMLAPLIIWPNNMRIGLGAKLLGHIIGKPFGDAIAMITANTDPARSVLIHESHDLDFTGCPAALHFDRITIRK